MKNNPAVPEGSLKSKPTWWNTSGCSATSAFFVVLLLYKPPQCCLRDSTRRHHSLSIQAEEECLMRVFMASFVTLLVLVALSPQVATAGHGGGGGHSWRRRPLWRRWLLWWRRRHRRLWWRRLVRQPLRIRVWRNYGYYQPATPYVVQRPILENPTFSGLPIEITNPATSGATLSYVLNDVTYSIPPGYSQNLTLDRSWVISFSRGGNFGPARYGLEPGLYTFTNTDHGWELYHGDDGAAQRRANAVEYLADESDAVRRDAHDSTGTGAREIRRLSITSRFESSRSVVF